MSRLEKVILELFLLVPGYISAERKAAMETTMYFDSNFVASFWLWIK